MNQPETYYSIDDTGAWAVIHQGMPLCAPTTFARAESVALRCKLAPVYVYTGDGFEAVQSAWKAFVKPAWVRGTLVDDASE